MLNEGSAIAQVVSHQLFTLEAGFAPRAVHMGFQVDKVLWFSHQYHSTVAPYSLMYHLGDGLWVHQWQQFHRDIISPHHNNNNNMLNVD
jgi:hypothetical protein